MNYLYLLLDLGSLSIPLLYSFHPKLKLYKRWKAIFLAIVTTMVVFIPWDVIFTQQGFWGFNETYFLNARIFDLPIEEWLFFICIPYACIFTHYALLLYFPKLKISKRAAKYVSVFLVILSLAIAIIYNDRWYPLVNFLFATLLITIVLFTNIELLQKYYLTFLVILVPFFLVNGTLTGSFIENQVVWYNPDEILGIRLFTIPIEDAMYAFTMILMSLSLTEYYQKKLFNN